MPTFKEKIKQNSRIKHMILNLIMHPIKTRPRWWVRRLQFMYLKIGKGSTIYRSVRKDLPPFNKFSLGNYSIIEDFCCLNNAVGDVSIGDHTRIGLGNTIIGPVKIGNHVNLAQNVVVSGLNHNYENPEQTIAEQGVNTALIHIQDDVWVGANSTILAGVTIGKHAIVAAGTVVRHDIPPYSICAGNPGKIIKQYDFNTKTWTKLKP